MAHKYGQIVNKRGIEFEQKLDLISIYMCYRYIDFFQRNHFFVFFAKVIIILQNQINQLVSVDSPYDWCVL